MAVFSDLQSCRPQELNDCRTGFLHSFSNSIYTICSGLTVFLILHVHANKEIMEIYINVLYLCFGVHDGGGSGAAEGCLSILLFKEISCLVLFLNKPVIPCWHGPVCHRRSEALSILVACVNGELVLGESGRDACGR